MCFSCWYSWKNNYNFLMAAILEKAKLDPTVINGGIINSYNSNAKIGFK